MHRFKPIARVGQRAVHDRGQGIGQITITDGAPQRLYRVHFGVCCLIAHTLCVALSGFGDNVEMRRICRKTPHNRGGNPGNGEGSDVLTFRKFG